MAVLAVPCLQINTQHCRAAAANLLQVVGKLRTLLVLIQEPYIIKGKVQSVPSGFKCFVGPGSHPRACIFAHSSLNCCLLPQFSDDDTCVVSVVLEGTNFLLVSSYMAGDSSLLPPPALIERVCEFSSSSQSPLVIGCDANSHHTSWGSSDVNKRGEALLEFLMGSDLIVRNSGDSPTFVTSVRQEVLDITLVSASAFSRLTDWRVLVDEPSLSDHRFISFSISLEARREEPVLYRSVRRTNWDAFRQAIDSSADSLPLHPPSTVDDIEHLSTAVTSCISNAFVSSCPLSVSKGKKTSPWWTPELSALRANARRLQRRAERQGDAEAWSEYRSALRSFKSCVRRTKRLKWRDFCGSVEGVHQTSRIVKCLSLDKSRNVNSLLKKDGVLCTSPAESLDALLCNSFPSSEDNVAQPPEHSVLGKSLLNSVINEHRLVLSISSFKPFKSPGPDGIYPCLMQRGCENPCLRKALTVLLRSCLSLGYVPIAWRQAKVIFIPKAGKKDYSDVKSFRPICLSSFLLKALERLVLWRLESVELRDFPLTPNQFAFCKGRSTLEALHLIVERLEKATLGGQFGLAAFLDIEGAFDNVLFSSFSTALVERKTHPAIVRWIAFMLRNRSVISSFCGVNAVRAVTRGGAQGSVLSPLLWNLIIDSLLRVDRSDPVHKIGFADDVTASVCGPDPSTLRDLLQGFLDKAVRWATTNGLKLSSSKTTVVMFTHRRKWSIQPLSVYGRQIPLSKEAKCLGIILDSRLSWIPHCNAKVVKALSYLTVLRRVVGTTWGLTPKNMWWVYRCVVLPAISYGAAVWRSALNNPAICRKFDKVQGLACRMITACYHSSPYAGLEAALNLPPLALYLRGEAALSALRIRNSGVAFRRLATPAKRYLQPHSDLCLNDLSSIPLSNLPLDRCITTLSLSTNFSVVCPGRDEFPSWCSSELTTNTIQCFTDGSGKNSLYGSGFCAFFGKKLATQSSIPLGIWSSVYLAEVFAISCCTHWLLGKGLNAADVVIFSDSQATLRALSSHVFSSKATLACARLLNQLADFNNVRLCWIPGHSGYPGNELADRLANQASDIRPVGPEPILPIPFSLVKSTLNNWVHDTHSRLFSARSDCRQSKLGIPVPSTKLRNFLLGLSRLNCRSLLMILTGHGSLNRHRFVQRQINSPTCPFCLDGDETPAHFLCECPVCIPARSRHLGAIISFSDACNVNNLPNTLRFLNDTQRLFFYDSLQSRPATRSGI